MTVDRLSLFDARTSSADDGHCSEGTKKFIGHALRKEGSKNLEATKQGHKAKDLVQAEASDEAVVAAAEAVAD